MNIRIRNKRTIDDVEDSDSPQFSPREEEAIANERLLRSKLWNSAGTNLATAPAATAKGPARAPVSKRKQDHGAKEGEKEKETSRHVWTDRETSDLLDIIQVKMPMGADSWKVVAQAHSEAWPLTDRNGDKCKKKFLSLVNWEIPSGAGHLECVTPPLVGTAKGLFVELSRRRAFSVEKPQVSAQSALVVADDGTSDQSRQDASPAPPGRVHKSTVQMQREFQSKTSDSISEIRELGSQMLSFFNQAQLGDSQTNLSEHGDANKKLLDQALAEKNALQISLNATIAEKNALQLSLAGSVLSFDNFLQRLEEAIESGESMSVEKILKMGKRAQTVALVTRTGEPKNRT